MTLYIWIVLSTKSFVEQWIWNAYGWPNFVLMEDLRSLFHDSRVIRLENRTHIRLKLYSIADLKFRHFCTNN